MQPSVSGWISICTVSFGTNGFFHQVGTDVSCLSLKMTAAAKAVIVMGLLQVLELEPRTP